MTAQGIKKSLFPGLTTVPAGTYFDFVVNGTNYRILDSDLYAAMGVTGTIVQEGDPLDTPVLNVSGSENQIRNLKAGTGITIALDASGSIIISSP